MSRLSHLFALCTTTAAAILPAQTSTVPATMPFQGRMTLANGANASGTFKMTFRLYRSRAGGAAVWTEVQPVVPVSNGVFKTELGSVTNFPPRLFDGRKLWLGVQVRSDREMSPRIPLTSNAFSKLAENALDVAGRDIHPNSVQVNGRTVIDAAGRWRGSPAGLQGSRGPQGPVGGRGPAGASGAQGATGARGATGPAGAQGAQGFQGPTGLSGAQGARGTRGTQGATGPQGLRGATGVSPFGLNGNDAYYTQGKVGIGIRSPGFRLHVRDGGASSLRVENPNTNNQTYGVHASINSANGGAALFGESTSSLGIGYGVYGKTGAADGRAVYGYATGSNRSYGVYGITLSPNTDAAGVYGIQLNGSGTGAGVHGVNGGRNGNGVWGRATNANGRGYGVRAESAGVSGRGLYAAVTNTRGYGVAIQAMHQGTGGHAVQAQHNGRTGSSTGVSGLVMSPQGVGVIGVNVSVAGTGSGVYGSSNSAAGRGVYGRNTNRTGFGSYGVYGESRSNGGYAIYGINTSTDNVSTRGRAGVHGRSGGRNGFGVYGLATGTNGRGVYGQAFSTRGWGVYSQGRFTATGTKSFTQPHPSDPSKNIQFICLEGNESGTYFRGKGKLVNGRATIDIPAEWQQVTAADGITVQVTAIRSLAQIAVMEQTREKIVVLGTADCEFNYFVNGVRRGFTDYKPYTDNHGFRPTVRGVPFGEQYPKELRDILVKNGTLNPDYTPNEATAAGLGWTMQDTDSVPVRERSWLSEDERAALLKVEASHEPRRDVPTEVR